MTAVADIRLALQACLVSAWAKRGPLAWLLLPVAVCYGLALLLRRFLYRSGRRDELLPVPVVVVGNLIAGGAGKTPTVLAVVRLLRERGWSPGIVSKGYGRSSGSLQELDADTPVSLCGDEPLLLHLRGGTPVVVGDDRLAAVRELLKRHVEVNVVLSDDGLQHWRLPRDIELIVFDERGVGNGWLLPAGPLREPIPSRLAPRSMVLYNASTPSTALPGYMLRRRLVGVTPLSAWWTRRPAERVPLANLANRPLLAVAAIACPDRFFAMLREHGLEVDELPLPDHYPYTEVPWPANTADVVLTEKDAVKLPPHANVGTTQVWVATLDLQIDATAQGLLLRWLGSAR